MNANSSCLIWEISWITIVWSIFTKITFYGKYLRLSPVLRQIEANLLNCFTWNFTIVNLYSLRTKTKLHIQPLSPNFSLLIIPTFHNFLRIYQLNLQKITQNKFNSRYFTSPIPTWALTNPPLTTNLKRIPSHLSISKILQQWSWKSSS